MSKKFIFITTGIFFLFLALSGVSNAYQIKEDGVYSQGSIIPKADVNSFQEITPEFGKDINNVYYNGQVITNADPDTFQAIYIPYSKDAENVYYYTTTLSDSDPNSFKRLKNRYSKDDSNVYYKGDIITNADPNTFQSDFECYYPIIGEQDFAKDENNYYQKGVALQIDENIYTAKSCDPDIMRNEITLKLEGKILLQIEKNGEAWYLNPLNNQRYFLGRPQDAFEIMRNFGKGMSNRDLEKIPVADMNLSNGLDSDEDGLSDQVEDALGTDKNKKDSDDDGFNDKDEILSGYDPTGSTKLDKDPNFIKGRKGNIYLQVNQNGEAWYVYPNNGKRYFLGRPQDAFNVMRSLGLGITDENLNKIFENK